MAKKKIFVSYDYHNDRHYKNLLLAWDKNSEFDFNMVDHSTDVSINSTDAATIKRAISVKINSATYFLCIVGSNTHKSNWVRWEIDKANSLNRKIVAVKTDVSNVSPGEILGVGAEWARGFTFNSISAAIQNV